MDRNVDIAVLLTEEQKRRLTATLYRYPPLSIGWMELIELVELWGDENLAPFLWSHLKASTEGSRLGANLLMRKLATLLKNQKALELTEKYEDTVNSMRWPEQEAIFQRFIEVIERAGAPRPFEIKNEPEKPDDPPLQQSAIGGTRLVAMLFAFAVLLGVVAVFRRR